MLKNYFKIAWRNLTGQKSTAIINMLGLAIGTSACLIIWLITHFTYCGALICHRLSYQEIFACEGGHFTVP